MTRRNKSARCSQCVMRDCSTSPGRADGVAGSEGGGVGTALGVGGIMRFSAGDAQTPRYSFNPTLTQRAAPGSALAGTLQMSLQLPIGSFASWYYVYPPVVR